MTSEGAPATAANASMGGRVADVWHGRVGFLQAVDSVGENLDWLRNDETDVWQIMCQPGSNRVRIMAYFVQFVHYRMPSICKARSHNSMPRAHAANGHSYDFMRMHTNNLVRFLVSQVGSGDIASFAAVVTTHDNQLITWDTWSAMVHAAEWSAATKKIVAMCAVVLLVQFADIEVRKQRGTALFPPPLLRAVNTRLAKLTAPADRYIQLHLFLVEHALYQDLGIAIFRRHARGFSATSAADICRVLTDMHDAHPVPGVSVSTDHPEFVADIERYSLRDLPDHFRVDLERIPFDRADGVLASAIFAYLRRASRLASMDIRDTPVVIGPSLRYLVDPQGSAFPETVAKIKQRLLQRTYDSDATMVPCLLEVALALLGVSQITMSAVQPADVLAEYAAVLKSGEKYPGYARRRDHEILPGSAASDLWQAAMTEGDKIALVRSYLHYAEQWQFPARELLDPSPSAVYPDIAPEVSHLRAQIRQTFDLRGYYSEVFLHSLNAVDCLQAIGEALALQGAAQYRDIAQSWRFDAAKDSAIQFRYADAPTDPALIDDNYGQTRPLVKRRKQDASLDDDGASESNWLFAERPWANPDDKMTTIEQTCDMVALQTNRLLVYTTRGILATPEFAVANRELALRMIMPEIYERGYVRRDTAAHPQSLGSQLDLHQLRERKIPTARYASESLTPSSRYSCPPPQIRTLLMYMARYVTDDRHTNHITLWLGYMRSDDPSVIFLRDSAMALVRLIRAHSQHAIAGGCEACAKYKQEEPLTGHACAGNGVCDNALCMQRMAQRETIPYLLSGSIGTSREKISPNVVSIVLGTNDVNRAAVNMHLVRLMTTQVVLHFFRCMHRIGADTSFTDVHGRQHDYLSIMAMYQGVYCNERQQHNAITRLKNQGLMWLDSLAEGQD
jgi:hypothetical protein